MKRIFLCVLASCFFLTSEAQHEGSENRIKKVIATFFEGLHNGDSSKISKTLHKEVKIQTTFTNKAGQNILKTETKAQLLNSIANMNPKAIYFEKLLSYSIKVDGNLASVWIPYEFYKNNVFSHCGANTFQLFDNNGVWQIIFLADMRRRANCKALIEKK